MNTLEPIRLRDDPGALSEAERAELLRYEEDRPDPHSHARILAGLEANAVRGVSPTPQRSLRWWGLGALCLALFLGALLWPSSRARLRRVQPVAQRAASQPSDPAQVDAIEAPRTLTPQPEIAVQPPRAIVAKQSRAQSVSQVPEAATDPRAEPLEELKLLARARRVLPSRPDVSWTLVEQHLHAYPQGALREEREVLAIEALVKLSRSAEAQRRARAFLRAFPNSSQRARLSLWLTQPNAVP